ncbi:MAG: ABC transporter ATP-binding protein [Bacteroides sp.]|nr:ABC transporter ATP-binding protein [Bacillota bacterium]MCM1393779.1 ABC transporter ATP-binding protein [[Eubacterium] siraeum]MCM1455591.1 ABC transporter ATP-binding protein [Bacteroides sp.]
MIELRGVTKQYLYGARVLGSTDMTVGDGEIVALLGDKGSGKTTLLKVAAGVTDCEGEVFIGGNPIAKRPDDVLMVFDDLAVFENRSFYYNLAYPLRLRGVEKDAIDRRVKACAERMGITACLYERAKKMPLIDVKRLAIARLFLREYKALFIDDITSGLDRDEADELWGEVMPIILQKASEGVSVIYSTHSAHEALSIADRIAVMHYGELKQIGTAKQIYDNPSNVWAAQALDRYYHFEQARLERRGGELKLILGVETPVSEGSEIAIDGSVFEGRIANGYEGEKVFIGWHSDDFADSGEREENVSYAVREGDAYVLHTECGICVKRNDKAESVCTLPKIERAYLFDYTNENNIFIK